MTRHPADTASRGGRSLGPRLATAWYRSIFYQWRLGGTRVVQVLLVPSDPWPGDSEIGNAILGGAFSFDSKEMWRGPELSINPHCFTCLRELKATGSKAGRRLGREMIRDWLDRFGRYDHYSWAADITAERLINWLSQYDYFCQGADDEFRGSQVRGIVRQTRHLSRGARKTKRGGTRVRVAKSLIYVGACLPSAQRQLDRGLTMLEDEVRHCIHPDGGTAERCPSLQHSILRDLIDVRSTLAASLQESSPLIQGAIDRAAPMLRGMRLGDGGLGVFNGGFEEKDWQIDKTLSQSGSTGKPPGRAPHTGFQRITAGRTTIMMDSGSPPPPGYDSRAHAGLLSFEMSVGRNRLIVNCGSSWEESSEWSAVGRTTAAHSTLVIENRNSSCIHGGGFSRRPATIQSDQRSQDGASLIEASHDGYAPAYGVVHVRRIYVSSNGQDVRGQDILKRAAQTRRNPKAQFAIRFHLHPEVTIDSMSIWRKGGQIIEISRLGGGAWQFCLEGGVAIEVKDSFYQGTRNERRRTRQIVLSGEYRGTEPRAVRWAIRRR